MSGGNTAVSVKGISKRFGEECVLKNVSRDFESGKIHGIIGNNGSGKTVLMKCICGFLIPEEGEVTVAGKRVGREVDFPADLGVIIETPGFLPRLSARKNLEILASLNKKIGVKEIEEAILRVGLDPYLKSRSANIRSACVRDWGSRRQSWKIRRS